MAVKLIKTYPKVIKYVATVILVLIGFITKAQVATAWKEIGQLTTRGSKEIKSTDKTIERPKMAYKTAQHVFTLFDEQLELVKAMPAINQPEVYAFQYHRKQNKECLITLWSGEARPAESYEPKLTTITIENGNFKNPVFVDLISGKIVEIPKEKWKKKGNKIIFNQIPIPDYPVLIANRPIVSK